MIQLSTRNTVRITCAIAVFAGWLIEKQFRQERREIVTAYEARRNAASEASTQRQKDAERRHRAELEAAFGGPLQSIVKNPALGLPDMLRGVARACAPAGTLVELRVDHFTEFDVDFVLPRNITDAEMALVTKTFLAECSTYVNSIRFLYAGQVIADADKRKIDSVQDWRTVPLEDLH